MKYPFYQRIVPLNKLVFVGDVSVPDDRPTWHFHASGRPLRAYLEYVGDMTAQPIAQEHTYYKRKTLTGDIFFVADVTPEID